MPKKPKKSKFRRVFYKKMTACLKEKNFNGRSVNNAVTPATVAWNTGGQNPAKLLNALQLEVFPYTKRAIVAKDCKRFYHTQRVTPSTQPNGKSKSILKTRKEAAAKQKFGLDYVPA